MTEFELATTAFQNATLEFHNATLKIQNAALNIQNATLELQKWGIIGQYAIGLLQIALIAFGLRLMERGGARRAALSERQHKETMAAFAEERAASEQRREEAMAKSEKRHEEAMAESGRRHDEAMAKSEKRHEETMTALEEPARRDDGRAHRAHQADGERGESLNGTRPRFSRTGARVFRPGARTENMV